MSEKQENWISLKEASKISGYSADYIGELIRKGKIPGKQVVCKVAWMTTREAILEYKEKQQKREKTKLGKKEKILEFLREIKRKILFQIEIFKIFWKIFGRYLVFFLFFVLFLLAFFSYFVFSLQKKVSNEKILNPQIEKIEGPTF